MMGGVGDCLFGYWFVFFRAILPRVGFIRFNGIVFFFLFILFVRKIKIVDILYLVQIAFLQYNF